MKGNLTNADKRVVSFFIWDPELERKIDCEVKMIDGISKLLNVATNLEHTIECNKALVLSQQRMLAFMAEIRRKQQNLLKKDETNLEPTKATVLLSDIRLPIVWNKMKKAKTEQKKFAVFCLAKIGCEIIDTQMKFIDKQSTEILFTDQLKFENVPHQFELQLEIYALNKSFALSSSGKDFANRYSYFSTHGSPHHLRKAAQPSTTEQTKSSKFVLVGRTTLTKNSAFRTARVRYLTLENTIENPLMRLPIETSFIARFVIQPVCFTRSSTFAGIVESKRVAFSCRISSGFFHGEEIVRNRSAIPQRFTLPIRSDTVILSRNDHLSFSIHNRGYDQDEFVVQDILMLNMWTRALQQHIVDIRAWESTFDQIPTTRRFSYQPLATSRSITDLSVSPSPPLKIKARSLDNLYQTEPMNHSMISNGFNYDISNQRNRIEEFTMSDHDDDSDDDFTDDDSILRTRL